MHGSQADLRGLISLTVREYAGIVVVIGLDRRDPLQ